jgi:hypothetical protein
MDKKTGKQEICKEVEEREKKGKAKENAAIFLFFGY